MYPDRVAASVVTFHRIYPGALPPMRADRSALGTIPAAAHQYCEALCSASAFGWYIFPPVDICLKWDGAEILHEVDGDWQLLTSAHLPEFPDYWDRYCPADLKGCAPPYITSVFVPGVVQIWSGILVSTAQDWSILVRPPANLQRSYGYSCYEGIVETDRFKPSPLFVNIRLSSTDRPIVIPRLKPLFQMQPLQRQCYTEANASYNECEGLQPDTDGVSAMSLDDWEGFRRTIRSAQPLRDPHKTGQYAVAVRKRAKYADA